MGLKGYLHHSQAYFYHKVAPLKEHCFVLEIYRFLYICEIILRQLFLTCFWLNSKYWEATFAHFYDFDKLTIKQGMLILIC